MAKDPYRFFRVEAHELVEGLSTGILELERGPAPPDLVARLLRLAHTLKGAARIVKQARIGELAHGFEDLLVRHRDTSNEALDATTASELLGMCDKIRDLLKTLDAPAKPAPRAAVARPTQPVDESLDAVRVERHHMDALLHGVTDSAVQVGALSKHLSAGHHLRELLRSHLAELQVGATPTRRALSLGDELDLGLARLVRDLSRDIERVQVAIAEVDEVAHTIRLVPTQTIVPALDRAVRDAAGELGKVVDFEVRGAEVRLDAPVLAAIRDALLHVVRNAVAHGIESEDERRAKGKPQRATIRLLVSRRANRITFECTDDGRGVDIGRVATAALAKGLIDPTEAADLTLDGALELLKGRGLTTSRELTEIAGRGIGMDVVRATVSRLKGSFTLRCAPGSGLTVALGVPVSVASIQGLLVETDGRIVALPLDSVRHALAVDEGILSRSSDQRSVIHDGRVLPFVPLERLLASADVTPAPRRVWAALIVEFGDNAVVVGVDRLLGTSTLVVRALPPAIGVDPVVAGATLDANGDPQLVLDPEGLVLAGRRSFGSVAASQQSAALPVLVVDDSLTTRMLEKTILESAGYEVDLATSAEEGLVKARQRRYGIFIVDVEMPGLDGFGFASTIQNDPALRDTPVVLVTSRNSPDDRRRGAQSGAKAYIAKGEFDQGAFLSTMRRLIG